MFWRLLLCSALLLATSILVAQEKAPEVARQGRLEIPQSRAVNLYLGALLPCETKPPILHFKNDPPGPDISCLSAAPLSRALV